MTVQQTKSQGSRIEEQFLPFKLSGKQAIIRTVEEIYSVVHVPISLKQQGKGK